MDNKEFVFELAIRLCRKLHDFNVDGWFTMPCNKCIEQASQALK